MFCPQCGAEYGEGFTRCSDCDVDLVSASPDRRVPDADETRLVVLRTFGSEFEARVALSAVEAAGIPATLRFDNEGGFNPSLSLTRGAQLIVRAEDVADAQAVLAAEG